jgi:hypothetical protein
LDEGPSKSIQTTKRRINSPEAYSGELLITEDSLDELERNEIWELIDEQLPMSYKTDYLRLINGEKVSQTRKESLLDELKYILGDEDVLQ